MSNNNDNHHNTCAICLEPLSNGESTIGAVHPCGHVFHVPCWEGWRNSRQSKNNIAMVKCVMCNKFSIGFCKLFLDLSNGLEGRRGGDEDDDDTDSLSSCSSSEHDESTSLNEEPTTAVAVAVALEAREEASALGEHAGEHPPETEAVRVTQPSEDVAASVDTSLRRPQVERLLEANESSSTNNPSNQGTSSVMEEETEESSNNNNADVIVIDGDDDMGDAVEKKEQQQQRKKRKRRSSTRTESSTSNDSHSDDKDKLDKYKRLAKRYKRSNKMLQSQREQHSKIQESLTEELDDANDNLELQQERIDELEKQVDVSELRLSGAALQVVQLKNAKEEAEKKLASLRQQLDMISSEMEKMKASHRLDLEKSQTGGMAECQQILEKNKLLIKQRDAYKDRLVHAVEAVQQLETKLRSLGHSTTLSAPPAVKERAVSVSTAMAKTAKLFRQMVEDHHHHPRGGVAAVRPEKPSTMQRMKPEEVDQCISKSSARAAAISNAQKKQQAPRNSLDVLDCLDRLPTASNLVQHKRKHHAPPSDSRKRAAMNASVKPRGLLPIHATSTSRPRPPAQPKKQLQRDIRSMFGQD